MGHWSAVNATEAYIKTMKIRKRSNEPDVAEFISAIAAGNNAQLIVIACAGAAGLTTLALIAAKHQTGGRLVCIVKGMEELKSSKQAIGVDANEVELVVGNAQLLLANEYKRADFVVVDCNLENHEGVIGAVRNGREEGVVVLGYNAFWKDSWVWSGWSSRLLPIGDGLLLMRVAGKCESDGGRNGGGGGGGGGRGKWVVRVDEGTGEEHVFRIRTGVGKGVGG